MHQTTSIPEPRLGPSSLLPFIRDDAQYTPEVMAARNAHFQAYENAARLATQSDANSHLLLQNHEVRIPFLNDNTLNDVGKVSLRLAPMINSNLPIQQQFFRGHVTNIPIFNNNNLENVGEINIEVISDSKIKNDSKQKKGNKSKQGNKIMMGNANQEQIFRSHTVHIPVNQFNGVNQPVTRVNQNLPQVPNIPVLVPIIRATDVKLENTESMLKDEPENKIQRMACINFRKKSNTVNCGDFYRFF